MPSCVLRMKTLRALLDLLDRLASHTAVRVAFGTVEKKVKNVYIAGDFSSSHLDDLVRVG